MSYTYFEEEAAADAAFRARGLTREALFVAAADATLNVMVEDLESIQAVTTRNIHAEESTCEMLLFSLLQELIYYKDAQYLLLRVKSVSIKEDGDKYVLDAEAYGEEIDPSRHPLNADVKAVTLYRFSVAERASGWEAYVVLDI